MDEQKQQGTDIKPAGATGAVAVTGTPAAPAPPPVAPAVTDPVAEPVAYETKPLVI